MNNCNNKPNTVSKKPDIRIIIAIAIAAVVILNAVIYLLPDAYRRFDITEADSYTLADSTKKYFSELDEAVTLYILDADGSNMKYEYLLKRIGNSSDNVKVKWVETKNATEKLEPLGIKEADVVPYLVIVESEKRSAVLSPYELISYRTENSNIISFFSKSELSAYEYEYYKQMLATQAQAGGEYAEQYAALLEAMLYDVEEFFNAEPYLCRTIEYVTVDVIPARYTLTGHGETALDTTEIGYYLSDSVGMTYKSLDLTGGAPIPDDAVSIMIFSPTSDISAAEKTALIDYLNGGGQLTLYTTNEALDLPNLTSVAAAYGMSAEKGIVSEFVTVEKEDTDETDGGESAEGADADGGSAKTESYVTDALSVHINTEHKAMSQLKGMSISPKIEKANALTLTNSHGLTLTPLLTTSNDAYIGDDSENKAPRAVAAVSEKSGGGTLLWFTGAGSFTTPILESTDDEAEMKRIYNNCALVVSSLVLAPFSYESTVTVPEARYFGERLMTVNDTSFVVYVVVIAVAVVVMSVVGVIIWYKRKKA